MTTLTTAASTRHVPAAKVADRDDQRRGAGLISGQQRPPAWAWELATDLAYGQIIAALTAAGPLPGSRDASRAQVHALVATGLAHLGYPACVDLDDRLRQLRLLSIARTADPAVSGAADRTWLRLCGGSRRAAQNIADLAYGFCFFPDQD